MGRLSSSCRDGNAEHVGDDVMRMGRAELRFGLAHLAEEQAVTLLEAHGNFADFEIEHDFVGARLLLQVPGGAERGMSGEGQLLVDGKDPHLVTFGALGGGVARHDEGGLAEIGLARQLLHLVVAQAAGVGEDRKLVALQRPRGENVKLYESESAGGHAGAPEINVAGLAREARRDEMSGG